MPAIDTGRCDRPASTLPRPRRLAADAGLLPKRSRYHHGPPAAPSRAAAVHNCHAHASVTRPRALRVVCVVQAALARRARGGVQERLAVARTRAGGDAH